MDKPYIVDFLSVVDTSKMLKLQKPIGEVDLKLQLEALLIERAEQGYRFVQMTESQRRTANGTNLSGLIIVFEKKEKS